MAALRKGIDNKFTVPDAASFSTSARKIRRGGFNRWRGAVPFSGNWHRVNHKNLEDDDLIEREETNKDRVRVLLDRYGIIFRELTLREMPALRWPAIFRSLRLMELSGEVLSGYFFKAIPGPQFISPDAFRALREGNQQKSVFWLNATDPISPCGLGLQSNGPDLPRRLSSNHLVFHGEDLVLVSERRGKTLTFHVAADDKALPSYVEVLHHLLYRSFQGLQKIEIEMINGINSRQSPYLDALETSFNLIRDHKSVYLQREI